MDTSSYLTFAEALETILTVAPSMKIIRCRLEDALNRVLAADIVADSDMPPLDLSAMDGFACRAEDRDARLTVVETIAAGTVPGKIVAAGECSRIMTGAPVPKGADTVVMFEDTEYDASTNTVTVVNKSGNRNIRVRAEDVVSGDVVLCKGTVIRPPHIAVLASVGKASVSVFKQPCVGIIATGDELVEPSCKPRKGQIRNSNSYQLCSQVLSAGCIPCYHGIVRDDPVILEQAITKALRESDLLLLSGGVSMGDFDFIPGILNKIGAQLLFEKIAVKPGHPTVFATKGEKRIFGMPGNPVSTFVIFEMLVRPFLYKMTGTADPRLTISLPLSIALKRKKARRIEFRPVRLLQSGSVTPLEYHGSGHIHAYTGADGIVALPAGVDELAAGSMVNVTLLR